MQIGKSTGQSIKEHYKIAKHGNQVPWSLMISTPKSSGCRVNAMFAGGDDKKDPLSSILIRYESGPTLSSFKYEMGGIGQTYYFQGRNSDWLVYAYPKKGVVAFVTNEDGSKIVAALLCVSPEIIAPGVAQLSPTLTPIVRIIDRHAGERRRMYFGSVSVKTSLDGLSMTPQEKSNLQDELRGATAGGTMLYQEYSTGSCDAQIDGKYRFDDGGSLSVSVSISGVSPYGPIEASGDSETSYEKHMDVSDSANFTIAFEEAFAKAQENFQRAMITVGPPTPEQTRIEAWNTIFNNLRGCCLNEFNVRAENPLATPFTETNY